MKLNESLDRAAWSCILHVLNNKMSAEEAEWWGRYAYQLATTGPYSSELQGLLVLPGTPTNDLPPQRIQK